MRSTAAKLQASMEVNRKKEEIKSNINKYYVETEAKQKLLRNSMSNQAETMKNKMSADQQIMMAKKEMMMDQQLAEENNLENQE